MGRQPLSEADHGASPGEPAHSDEAPQGGFAKWCARHEIVFKTVAAFLLSVMALAVASAQLYIAFEQRSLAALQTKIVEANALPQFEIAVRQRLNTSTQKFDDNYLVVTNSGGPVSQFHVRAHYFLKIRAIKDRGGDKIDLMKGRLASTEFDLPINGYFTAQFVSAAGKGELATIIGHRNNATFIALETDTRELAVPPRWDSFLLDQVVYVSLQYFDLLQRYHHDLYRVPLIGAGWRIEEAEARKFLQKWKNIQTIELTSLTPERMFEEAEQRIKSDGR